MIQNDIILFALEVFMCAVLFLVAGAAEKYASRKWRVLYLVPAVVCMFLTALEGFEISLLGLYAGSLLLTAGFFREKLKERRIVCSVSALLVVTALPVCLLNKGYRGISYTEDFKNAMAKIEKHYILTEHKGIDLDALYEEYLPLFSEAEKAHDPVANCAAWLGFCGKFNDGHVGFSPSGNSEEITDSAYERIMGNDHGLCIMTLADGTACAVNVDPSLNAQGIFNGTAILSWDGKSPSELGHDKVKYGHLTADADNEEFWRAAFGSGTEKDSVKVTFLDENGNEKSAELPKTGEPYYKRFKSAVKIIDQGIEAGHLTWTDINAETAALRIKMMMSDFQSYQSGDHTNLKNELRVKLEDLKQKNVDTIIIDMRGNVGGSGDMVKAIAELFAPEGRHYYCTDGLWDDSIENYAKDENGRYIKGRDVYFIGEDLWKDRKIIMLVNSSSVSAADHLAKVMGQFENVTVAGFTESNGSAQGVGGISLESGYLSISGSLILDSDGDIFIDSGTDRQSGNQLDVKIPFDKTAVKALFEENRDYLLDQVTENLG